MMVRQLTQQDLQNYVNNNRSIRIKIGRNGVQPPYDTISGPMLKNVNQVTELGKTPKAGGQQTIFLSDKSVDLFR